MAKLTTRGRKQVKPSNFALPMERMYPIMDITHARNALARVAANGTPEEKAKVRSAVAKKFPSIKQTKGAQAKSGSGKRGKGK